MASSHAIELIWQQLDNLYTNFLIILQPGPCFLLVDAALENHALEHATIVQYASKNALAGSLLDNSGLAQPLNYPRQL